MKRSKRPALRESQILAWADAHYKRTGSWPKRTSGRIIGTVNEFWHAIDMSLRKGQRGLPDGGSLPRLLSRRRGVRHNYERPRLTIKKILAWADAHHRRTGRWPSGTMLIRPGGVRQSTPVFGVPGETWVNLHQALVKGLRGLPPGDSLAKVLLRYRGVRRTVYRPQVSIAQILAWADAHYRRTGRWPNVVSGPVHGVRGETWFNIQNTLMRGQRGLPGGSSLAQLLEQYRGMRNRGQLPPFKKRQLLAWADEYILRTGKLPQVKSGPILGAPGETWGAVQKALIKGHRGMPGGSSLYQFLKQHGRARD